MSASDVLTGLTLGVVSDWVTTLGLIFGGCCRFDGVAVSSNALTLEQLTRSHPHSGSLITFAQFILISLHGLPKFFVFSPISSFNSTRRSRWWLRIPVPHLRPRKIPLAPYLAQVALFYGISLLNNAAFAYSIPMPVHIIFRSGGLVISMLMGWLLAGKRYNITQVLSVLLVTAGVVLTTLSASAPKTKSQSAAITHASEQWRYATGIALLTLALVLSGLLGIVQDWTYAHYVRAPPASPPTANGASNGSPHMNGHTIGHTNGHAKGKEVAPTTGERPKPTQSGETEPWQESMFYLHFLSLPMFVFIRQDLVAQAHALHASAPLRIRVPLPPSLSSPLERAFTLYPPIGLAHAPTKILGLELDTATKPDALVLALPGALLALALTALTALVCVAGVHRLSARGVSALTVTLLLVVRKAASLVLSVVLFRGGGAVNGGVWAGAGLVFAGTMGYAAGSRRGAQKAREKEKKE
ncbi:UAA transporter [Trametes elegans]|nr:UAA transporter [Trametes elegans]